MSIYKRGKNWYVYFAAPDGEIVRHSAGTQDRQAAQEYHDKLKIELWRQHKIGDKVQHTWDEAAFRFLQETEHKKDHGQDIVKVRWFTPEFRGLKLHELTRDVVKAVTDKKQAETTGATANRYRSLVSSILNRAVIWGWLEYAPKLFKYQEAKRRIRTLTVAQVDALMNALPAHQKDVVTFALATGLRQSNVLRLEWVRVDMERRVCWMEDTKNGEALGVALNDTAFSVLTAQLGKHPERVFTYRDTPLNSANTRAWRRALKEAGITNFRWHDLRHVWASWLVQKGVPLFALQEMAGWKTTSMVRRYAHLSPEHLARHASVLDTHFGSYSTNTAH